VRHGDELVVSNPPVEACTQFPLVSPDNVAEFADIDVNAPVLGVVAPMVPFRPPEVELRDVKTPVFGVAAPIVPLNGPDIEVKTPLLGVVPPMLPFKAPDPELSDVKTPVLGVVAPIVVDSISDSVIKTLNRLVGVAPFTFTMGANSMKASKRKTAPRAASVFFIGKSPIARSEASPRRHCFRCPR
jgi:hypothetical protein